MISILRCCAAWLFVAAAIAQPVVEPDRATGPAQSLEQGELDGFQPQIGRHEFVVPRWRSFVSALDPQICWFRSDWKYDAGRVQCGYVNVPEDRSNPASVEIRIAVAVVKANSAEPGVPPTVILTGGPGQPAIETVGRFLLSNPDFPLLQVSDVVLVDQRGTGFSERDFCRALRRPPYTISVMGDASEREQVDATERCLADARNRGIAIHAYSTWHSAHDFRTIRRALGYDRWNLFGVSYGTQLGQMILEVDSEGVRAAVLDSVVPLQDAGFDNLAAGLRSSLNALDEACAASSACSARFSKPSETLNALIEAYSTAPVVLTDLDTEMHPSGELTVNGPMVTGAIFNAFYDRRLFADLPMLLEVLADKDPEALKAYVDVLGRPADHAYGGGLEAVANCRGAPLLSTSAIQQAFSDEPLLAENMRVGYLAKFCEALRMRLNLAGAERTPRPVESSVPVLVLAGLWDPITPPGLSRRVMRGLSKGQLVEFPYTGHGAASTPCGRTIVADFVRRPEAAMDTGCVTSMDPPRFTTDLHRSGGLLPIARSFESGSPSTAQVVTLLGFLVAVFAVLAYPLGWLGRKVDGRTMLPADGCRLVSWLAASLTVATVVTLAAGALKTLSDHLALIPAGFLTPAQYSGWLMIVAVLAVLGSIFLVFRARRHGSQPIGTTLGVFVTGLACLTVIGALIGQGLFVI